MESLVKSLREHGLPMRLYWRYRNATNAGWGLWSALSAAYWGVELGEGCIFYGPTIFRTDRMATVSIGPRCQFRSLAWANPVGVNRPCAVAAYAPGAKIVIGAECGFSGTTITAAESIRLGDRVTCGPNVTITDSDWKSLEPGQRRGPPATPQLSSRTTPSWG